MRYLVDYLFEIFFPTKSNFTLEKMDVIALCSGGKDSAYSIWRAMEEGHRITDLVAMIPERDDSWMFHKPDPDILELFSRTSDIPLAMRETKGVKEKELEDLRSFLKDFEVDGIVSGAVASNYQRNRIERVSEDLHLRPLFPLWHMDPLSLLEEMICSGFVVMITSVSAGGLNKSWLGKILDRDCLENLKSLSEAYGLHLSGEGGEYETLTLDAPFFKKEIKPLEVERVWRGDRGNLVIKRAKLAGK